ncbi:hypothetical protein [Metamycoplasma hyosynoviae]|uniref:Uncharacterized protein n=1 Tax=Metamycoplasma hyosynoviae TaxID=29559 RepID=A0A063YKM2_9BACT|nr:hypothetical protein [Metamycoplasma hyosynoviae]KDE45236.1 hypothetical protein NPL4_01905 [Metamycoplasma hyosynoviae]MDC8900397.1 hypothetical protein [Metamycoplasma hyosynoviae]MDC8917316.1 hypothetical protein [Metamycoplasma hyosynoviae]MDD1359374.1 hypothetical protein [Metamycoplasma hyosynoviae]MDD1366393.1 hypothetical protein [Metamycoplasma hyosynoviae]
MKKFIENLASLFNLKVDEVKEKLNITDDTDSKALAKKLGVYSLYLEKEDHSNYLNSKLANKEELISNQTKELTNNKEVIALQKTELENLAKEKEHLENIKNKLNNSVKAEWLKLGIKRPFEKENIDIYSLDYSNLSKSIIDYAKNEGLAIQSPNYDDLLPANSKSISIEDEDDDNQLIIVNGAIKK